MTKNTFVAEVTVKFCFTLEVEFRVDPLLLSFFSQMYILKKEEGGRHKPFVSNYTPQMYIRTGDVAATITLDEGKDFVMPGEDASFQLTLFHSMPLEQGLRFTMREGSRTVGTGVVTEVIDD